MSFDYTTLITDRTQADVARVKALAAKGWAGMTEEERAEWMTDLKGAYNASDINRVGAAVDYIAQRLTEQGYSVSVDTKTDWANGAEPTEDDWAAYLASVAAVRKIAVKPTTPALPATIRFLGYTGANDIEQILVDLNTLLTNAEKARYYSGELYAGEV